MAIRRRCKYRTCKNARRCLEHLQFDMKYEGIRYRVGVNDFAIPRMEPGRQRPIESIEEARDWERLFIGEVKAGRDPRRPPKRSMQARPSSARWPGSWTRTWNAASSRHGCGASTRSAVASAS